MAKRKLKRFAELETFSNVFQPKLHYPPGDFELKGNWNKNFFKNHHPIVLELGCGRGEYTVYLAKTHPEKNFIGIDIKGARLWKGAKTAAEERFENTAFVRTQIEYVDSFFSEKEISEIWITFPDPQLHRDRELKRLTSLPFLEKYKKIISPNGIIHLKTDSKSLFDYTLEVIEKNGFRLLNKMEDIYSIENIPEELQVKTTYEKMFLAEGSKINYLEFSLG